MKDLKRQENDPLDTNYKTEVKHFVSQVPKPTRRVTEVSFPVAGATTVAPLPPRYRFYYWIYARL